MPPLSPVATEILSIAAQTRTDGLSPSVSREPHKTPANGYNAAH